MLLQKRPHFILIRRHVLGERLLVGHFQRCLASRFLFVIDRLRQCTQRHAQAYRDSNYRVWRVLHSQFFDAVTILLLHFLQGDTKADMVIFIASTH